MYWCGCLRSRPAHRPPSAPTKRTRGAHGPRSRTRRETADDSTFDDPAAAPRSGVSAHSTRHSTRLDSRARSPSCVSHLRTPGVRERVANETRRRAICAAMPCRLPCELRSAETASLRRGRGRGGCGGAGAVPDLFPLIFAVETRRARTGDGAGPPAPRARPAGGPGPGGNPGSGMSHVRCYH